MLPEWEDTNSDENNIVRSPSVKDRFGLNDKRENSKQHNMNQSRNHGIGMAGVSISSGHPSPLRPSAPLATNGIENTSIYGNLMQQNESRHEHSAGKSLHSMRQDLGRIDQHDIEIRNIQQNTNSVLQSQQLQHYEFNELNCKQWMDNISERFSTLVNATHSIKQRMLTDSDIDKRVSYGIVACLPLTV